MNDREMAIAKTRPKFWIGEVAIETLSGTPVKVCDRRWVAISQRWHYLLDSSIWYPEELISKVYKAA